MVVEDVFTSSFDDDILFTNFPYIIGLNDSKEFKKVVYKGTKLFHGKNMLTFETIEGDRLTINPSYLSFALESPSHSSNYTSENKETKGDTQNG